MPEKEIKEKDIIELLKRHNVYNGRYEEQEHLLMQKLGCDFREAHKWLCQIF